MDCECKFFSGLAYKLANMVRVLGQPGRRHLLLSFLILRVISTNVLDGGDDDVLSDVVLLWGKRRK